MPVASDKAYGEKCVPTAVNTTVATPVKSEEGEAIGKPFESL